MSAPQHSTCLFTSLCGVLCRLRTSQPHQRPPRSSGECWGQWHPLQPERCIILECVQCIGRHDILSLESTSLHATRQWYITHCLLYSIVRCIWTKPHCHRPPMLRLSPLFVKFIPTKFAEMADMYPLSLPRTQIAKTQSNTSHSNINFSISLPRKIVFPVLRVSKQFCKCVWYGAVS